MRIETEELANLVAFSGFGALPTARIDTTIAAVRRDCTSASTVSPQSLWLQSVLAHSADEVRAPALERLREIEIYGVDLPLINALARQNPESGRPQIIVFNGLLQLVRYYTDILTVLSYLQRARPGARYRRSGGEDEDESLALSTACFAILSDFMQGGKEPGAIGDLLGPTARSDVRQASRKAAAFTLLHELGHHELGHVERKRPFSETGHLDLVEGEALNLRQRMELEADHHAVRALRPERSGEFADGVMFLFGAYAFQEVFTGRLGGSHPLAVNRLHALAQNMNLDARHQAIVGSWIDDQVANFRRHAPQRSAEGGAFKARIHRTMPVDQAYRDIANIRARIIEDVGLLDRAP
jgi:hypothetical protein